MFDLRTFGYPSLEYLLWLRFCAPRKYKEADKFAAKKHRGQPRKSIRKIPYIIHPREVSWYVRQASDKVDDHSLEDMIAALFHDLLEDQHYEGIEEYISTTYGHSVLELMKECTNQLPKTKSWVVRKEAAHEALYSLSRRATRLKLFDNLSNIPGLIAVLVWAKKNNVPFENVLTQYHAPDKDKLAWIVWNYDTSCKILTRNEVVTTHVDKGNAERLLATVEELKRISGCSGKRPELELERA